MEHNILSRLATFLIVLSACILGTTSDGTDTLDQIYEYRESKKVTNDSLKCEQIEGRVLDCSECYSCEHEAVARHRAMRHDITELTLNDDNCDSSETICCVSQKDLKFRESINANLVSCGRSNPQGSPRALRASLRAVLPGEYPWRAWIYYLQEPNVPLCAATYVNREGRTLLTSASCVDGRKPHALRVRFSRDPSPSDIAVRRIDVHEDYNKESHANDIAVLSVESVPEWSERACLPLLPAPHGTACIAVSQQDYYLNQVIPRQSKCKENGTLDDSLMCTATMKGDFTPEDGAGLYCVDEQYSPSKYTVYGVYLMSSTNSLAALNTNVTHFTAWISRKAEQHRFL